MGHMGRMTARHEIIRLLGRGLVALRRDGGAVVGGALRGAEPPRIADRFARAWRDSAEDNRTGYHDQEAVDGR